MKLSRILFTILSLGLVLIGCKEISETKKKTAFSTTDSKKLTATIFHSGFENASDTYNSISSASDGRIYYVLSSGRIDEAGQMYSFDPKTKKIEHLADLTEVSGEKDLNAIAQGKSHADFFEVKKKLYFSTHLGYYDLIDGMEKVGSPKEGYIPYQGGHILSYDLKKETFRNLAIAPQNEGILTMEMDTVRELIYGLTWPTGYFFRYNVSKDEMINLGPFTGKGEGGHEADFRVICRSIAINPRNGTVFLTNAEGEIKTLKPGEKVLKTIEGENMRKDYFGKYDISTAGSMAYNWRQVFWYPPEEKIYGVHGNSGYLFRLDPSIPRIEVLERLSSEPSKLSGMHDQFSYGYLGFKLGPDGRTIYYLTGGPIYINGKRVKGANSTAKGEAKGLENLHLITYDIPTEKYTDHGAIFYPNGERPLYVNSIAIDDNGTIYTTARIRENGKTRVDLISIPSVISSDQSLH